MNNSKTSLLSLAILCLAMIYPNSLLAQDDKDVFELYRQQINNKFEATRQTHEKQFRNYRDSINNVFAEYLQKEWAQSSLYEGVPSPIKPEPKPIVDTTSIVSSRPLPHSEPISEEIPTSRPEPKEPIEPKEPVSNTYSFSFFGVQCKVHAPASSFKMKDASQESLVAGWEVLSSGCYDQLLKDCLYYRESLNLCDWGVYQFLLTFSRNFFSEEDSNEAVLFQIYSLSQLGYKVRLCQQGEHLINLIAFSQQVFSAPYIEIDGVAFYYLSTLHREGEIKVCDFAFPDEKGASLHIASLPLLPYLPTAYKKVQSEAFPSVSTSVRVNKNLIDFFDTYPCCSWELFAEPSLSNEVKAQLYPILKEKIKNLSEKDAANILLNFVQTGFEYKTDDEQFGREKTFFGDEPFFYPYCDCEDRSILYAILVRDLLELDVVLLDYPSHIATAVHFRENVSGDYFELDGKKYIICDPTYIGAPIGKSMPEMLRLKANILRIK